MLPTIGRIVHVNIGPSGRDLEDIWRPAIVTAIIEDNCINVRLFLDGDNDARAQLVEQIAAAGHPFDGGSPRLAALTPGDGLGQWRWPPQAHR